MNKILKLILLMLLSSCAVYNTQPAQPFITNKKKEVVLSAGFGYGLYPRSLSLNLNAQMQITNRFKTLIGSNIELTNMFNFNFKSGYDITKDSFVKFTLIGGYRYGVGNVFFSSPSFLLGISEKWNGNYNLPYGGFQLDFKPYPKFYWGINANLGQFRANFIEKNYNNLTKNVHEINSYWFETGLYTLFWFNKKSKTGMVLSMSYGDPLNGDKFQISKLPYGFINSSLGFLFKVN